MLLVLKDATILGVAVLLSAAALQGLYKVTNFYPPAPVFWFFSGFSGYLILEAVEHLSHKELIDQGHLATKDAS